MAEHAKKACMANRDIQLTRDSKGRIVVRKPSQKPRTLQVYRTVPSVAANLGGVSPRLIEILAAKHNIELKSVEGRTVISDQAWSQLRRVPEMRNMIRMARLKDIDS